MPFRHHHRHEQIPLDPAKGALQAAGAVGLAVGAPSLQRLGECQNEALRNRRRDLPAWTKHY